MNNIYIQLFNISKKYYSHFLYKNLNLEIPSKDKIVITGNNGSGKSTLLKIITGLVSPTSGKVIYLNEDKFIHKSEWYKYISVAAPYMGLIEDFSVNELTEHLFVFRKYQLERKELTELLELDKHIQKPIKYFSSGMKQKLRLLLAITDTAPILLLDEPTSNLDGTTTRWYSTMIEKFATHKTILVFSNFQQQEYFFCNKHIDLSDYL